MRLGVGIGRGCLLMSWHKCCVRIIYVFRSFSCNFRRECLFLVGGWCLWVVISTILFVVLFFLATLFSCCNIHEFHYLCMWLYILRSTIFWWILGMRVLGRGRCVPLLPLLEAIVCLAFRCVSMLGNLHLVGLFLVDAVLSFCLLLDSQTAHSQTIQSQTR